MSNNPFDILGRTGQSVCLLGKITDEEKFVEYHKSMHHDLELSGFKIYQIGRRLDLTSKSSVGLPILRAVLGDYITATESNMIHGPEYEERKYLLQSVVDKLCKDSSIVSMDSGFLDFEQLLLSDKLGPLTKTSYGFKLTVESESSIESWVRVYRDPTLADETSLLTMIGENIYAVQCVTDNMLNNGLLRDILDFGDNNATSD